MQDAVPNRRHAIIIAIDPGQHTGMAFRFDNQEWGTFMADKVEDDQERLAAVLVMLNEYLAKAKDPPTDPPVAVTVVVESFDSMGRYLSRFGIETIELIGAIRAVCWMYDTPVVKQAPLQRKPFEREAMQMLRERAVKLRLTVTDHEVSALSHLLRYEYDTDVAVRRANAAAPRASRVPIGPARIARTVVDPSTIVPRHEDKPIG